MIYVLFAVVIMQACSIAALACGLILNARAIQHHNAALKSINDFMTEQTRLNLAHHNLHELQLRESTILWERRS